MTTFLPHVREPPGEPDVCAYCCEEWMDVDPTEACPLRSLGLATIRELNAMPRRHAEESTMPVMTFTYTNWHGETAHRRVLPMRLHWGATEWHPDAQWLMEATDLDRGTVRTFAMANMTNIGGAP